ncbi:ABC transporter ATP-binding protein [Hymenobacter sp. HDW8]|uniref:ABC transporter ATP-binding protein n=1 Tax=Hymenobacter sp. HDW8 TaxID=2714932 RepID=UPI00140CBB4A|nr:ABC transporter ATP-binding protein [Hymenobacter sp. HDW8]QIL75233.1 ABC transporter ATP-binding protein [Hymenobacter sp. HDW8]
MSLLTVSGITLQEEKYILKDVSFTQQKLQKIALAGETGAGKSTLLQTIAGLVQPTAGEVWFDGRRAKGPAEQLMPGNPGISYLSQQFELPKFLRVEQVLKYANKLTGAEAQTLFEVCRIDHLGERRTDQLSGGERQRIALAKLLLSSPKLLLLDEPFSNLDMVHKNILKSVIQDIGERLQITCILISHDPLDTLSWADEIVVMYGGQIVQKGPPAQIYNQPANEYVAGLFGTYNLITSAGQAKAFVAAAGAKSKRKTMLIRPEKFMLNPVGLSALSGEVKTVRFFGSYSELDVQVAGSIVRVRTNVGSATAGDTVNVSLAADAVWYI